MSNYRNADPQPRTRQEEILAEIRAAADRAYDAKPPKPLSARAARYIGRLLGITPESEAAIREWQEREVRKMLGGSCMSDFDPGSLSPEARVLFDQAIENAARAYVAGLRELQEQELLLTLPERIRDGAAGSGTGRT